MPLISASILSADFANLGAAVAGLKKAGADMVHIDVMDGHFVPNITIGAPVVKALRPYSTLPFDVHLMIENPLLYAESFAKAGADYIGFHAETGGSADDIIDKIKQLGCKVCLSIKPKTPAEAILPYIKKLDMVLVMTVEPGFGGQSFMADMLPKIEKVKKFIISENANCFLQVDGGVNERTSKLCVAAGANVLVAGNYLFASESIENAVKKLKQPV
jgi:ribulose-phosphate 3-epimerase